MRTLTTYAAHAAILSVSILGTVVSGVAANPDTATRARGFIETDLVANKSPLIDSNRVSHTPAHVDTNLLNPWGLTASLTSPFWVSDNGAGVSTLYNASGVAQGGPLVVLIPAPGDKTPGPDGAPTGVVFNTDSSGFVIHGFDKSGNAASGPARFLFATEDGTILGWNPGVNPMNFDPNLAGKYAVIAVNNANNPVVGGGAVYKGLAIATVNSKTFLYVTNFRAGTVEVYDDGFNRVVNPGAFTDLKLPKGYAPFNIALTGGKLVVTYAVQNSAKHDDVAGMSHGIVNTFDLNGQSLQRLIQHGQLNSPWGVAVAPTKFGALAGALLIGNFGNGQINAYNATSGKFIDKVRSPHGQAIVIDGLWSVRVGSGNPNGGDDQTIYFTAGPNGEKDGLFGSITSNP
jgi:uncharacterized protein (TIGR03118 family)